MSKAPIEPQNYLYGPKVVQIEDLRVARGMTRRPASSCRHRQLVYDDKERRVWCQDCEQEVEPFDAFMNVVGVFQGAAASIKRRQRELEEVETSRVISRAAKTMDSVWRKRDSAPLCPHCSTAILPEDVAKGVGEASRSLVMAARKRNHGKPSK